MVQRVRHPQVAAISDADAIGLAEAGSVGGDGVGRVNLSDDVVLRVGHVNVAEGIHREADGGIETCDSTCAVRRSGDGRCARDIRHHAVEADVADGVVTGVGDDEAAAGGDDASGVEEACVEARAGRGIVVGPVAAGLVIAREHGEHCSARDELHDPIGGDLPKEGDATLISYVKCACGIHGHAVRLHQPSGNHAIHGLRGGGGRPTCDECGEAELASAGEGRGAGGKRSSHAVRSVQGSTFRRK